MRPNLNVTKSFEKIASKIQNPNIEENELDLQIQKFLSSNSQTMMLPINPNIINCNENIRDLDGDKEIETLMDSIGTAGIIHPPVLAIRSEIAKYELVCVTGHRRLLAAKKLGIDKVVCLIRKFKDTQLQLISTIVENTHRKNLHPLEFADGIRRLLESGYSFEELEKLFDRNQWNLRRFNKMNDWTTTTKKLIKENIEEFTSTFLIRVASRTLNPQEVEDLIKTKLGLIEINVHPKSKKEIYNEKVKLFFETRKLSDEQKLLIYDLLKDLGLS